MVKLFYSWYFIYLAITIILSIIVGVLLYKKDNKSKYLFVLALINFILHFAKQFIYRDISYLHTSTAENICAISTLLLPWMILSKKESAFKDFVYFLCLFGGFVAILYPTTALSIAKSSSVTNTVKILETIRFYFNHWTLFISALLLNKPKLKSIKYVPAFFLLYQLILCANTALVTFTGLTTRDGYTALDLFLDNRLLNNSFTFGPTEDMGWFGDLIRYMIPNFMKYEWNGKMHYWPVLCLIFPSITLIPAVFVLSNSLFWIKNKNFYELDKLELYNNIELQKERT